MDFKTHLLINSLLIGLLLASHIYQWTIISFLLVSLFWITAVIGIILLPFLKVITPILEDTPIYYYPYKKYIDLVIYLSLLAVLLYTGHLILAIAYSATLIVSQFILNIAEKHYYSNS